MQRFLAHVEPDETSPQVAILHQALRALGMDLDPDELGRHTAGPDTQEKVGALQERLGVPVQEAGAVDAATATALMREMAARGLLDASRSFTVAGTVHRPDGTPEERRRLLAFDVDLRGVRAYQHAETFGDLEGSGGAEVLGETTSETGGAYSLTFYDWQYRRAERGTANVVVIAVADDDRVVGRSRLVYAEDYSETGLVADLDVVIEPSEQPGTEYERMMPAVTALLEESQLSLGDVAASPEEVEFVARELRLDPQAVTVAAAAEVLAATSDGALEHQLLYGIGREGIELSWTVLYRRTDGELQEALTSAAARGLIADPPDADRERFLSALHVTAARHVLVAQAPDGSSLESMLAPALPEPDQRRSFAEALAMFDGADPREFWEQHLPAREPFAAQPQLVSRALFAQRLTALTGNHQPLVEALMVERGIDSVDGLVALEADDWRALVDRVGVPGTEDGGDESRAHYAEGLKSLLDASFPTQRLLALLRADRLPVTDPEVRADITAFLDATPEFDLASSRVHDFSDQIAAIAADRAPAATAELMRFQRVFQVSTSPEAMSGLLERQLDSAHAIAAIPRKSFVNAHGNALGGASAAIAIHQRASHIAARTELAAARLLELVGGALPQTVVDETGHAQALEVLSAQLPNWTELFGSPDLCECRSCRSVYSPAAYLVDLLRFLWRSEPNAEGRTPLDVLSDRRPDLQHLALTCENTNTLLPYTDVAAEVMEHFAANDSLAGFLGYDTGSASEDELRASPQNVDLEAYRRIARARFPFTLPYHQPLDVIRAYSDHLSVTRYGVMRAMHPQPDAATQRAISSERLRLSPEDFATLTGEAFDGTPDGTPLHAQYGYQFAAELAGLSAVREFLERTGSSYEELVDLLRTRFVNPQRRSLKVIDRLLGRVSIDPATLYQRLSDVASGALDPATDPDLTAALQAFAAESGQEVTPAQLQTWVQDHFEAFRIVITLYEPQSRCDLDTTMLRIIAAIYEGGPADSGVTDETWSRVQRLIRLSRRLALSFREVDLLLAALHHDDIAPDTIEALEHVAELRSATRLSSAELGVLWGGIDTDGDQSLYARLFLNRAVQQIDDVFRADAWGDHLGGAGATLADHRAAILAAFRIREQDLTAILATARVVEGGVRRPLDATDALDVANLSALYRHVVLARALGMRPTELCTLISVFAASPFTTWDIDQGRFVDIDPGATRSFVELARTVREAGFRAVELAYVIRDEVATDARVGLDENQAQAAVRALHDAFAVIERDHPSSPTAPLAPADIGSRLVLTFQPPVAARLMAIVEDNAAPFEAFAATNLPIDIPTDLAPKFTYVRGSGRLASTGVVSDTERDELKALPGTNGSFDTVVDDLYEAPEHFLAEQFGGIFDDATEVNAVLLNHPAQVAPATLDERLAYVYEHFVPVLKAKLRHDVLTQQVAALIGATEAATGVLIAPDVEQLAALASTEGLSASYFGAPDWTAPALDRTDATIDFSWDLGSPDPAVPADGFSVRWQGDVTPPAVGTYTLLVDVAEPGDHFALRLDGALLLEKPAGDARTSWEVVAELDAARMHRLQLDYAHQSQRAAIRLRWKTAMTGPEVLPASSVHPARDVDAFVALARQYHRGARLVAGFGLDEQELRHLTTHPGDFDGLDFKTPTPDHWRRLSAYTELRDAVPQASARLIDVFTRASTADPAPTVAELTELVHDATAWDEPSLTFLVTDFGLGVDDFRNEVALNRLRAVMEIVAGTGISAQTAARWGAPETDFDELHQTAQIVKRSVKARYGEQDWLELAGQLSDSLRVRRRDALVAYLLTLPTIYSAGVTDADALYEHLLIDVQMGACMDTSRVVQASAAVQQFVNRCLLNLESDASTGAERGVSPRAIDASRWEWMRNYRVWEANRKVFLYPENWLEPEWRQDRSAFFRELESFLVQNDITDASVEDGLRGYLASLETVANLDICGLCREDHDDGTLRYLHVFGRTRSAPYAYHHRTWNEYRKWSPWERVPVDIRPVEDAAAERGENSGIGLAPVVWKKRLYLFWPEFLRVTTGSGATSASSVQELADDKTSTFEPTEVLQIRLGWSAYVDGRWTPKAVTKEYLREWSNLTVATVEKDFLLTPSVDPATQQLTIRVSDTHWNFHRGEFRLADIRSPVQVQHDGDARLEQATNYRYEFFKRRSWSRLELEGDVYLRNASDHGLLPLDSRLGLDIRLNDPFFFADPFRTYFVRPVNIHVSTQLQHPETATIPRVWEAPQQPIGSASDPLALRDATPGMRTAIARTPSAEMQPTGAGRPLVNSRALLAAPARDAEYELTVSRTGAALGEAARSSIVIVAAPPAPRGLEFHTFDHPYCAEYVRELNRGGVARLLAADTTLPSDDGAAFEAGYDPNLAQFVQKPADFPSRTYYKRNVCFDVFGANSSYNMELFFHVPVYIATRLSRNGRFEEAMKWFHHVFDPTTDEAPPAGQPATARYWKVSPFRTTPAESLEDWFRGLAPNADPTRENSVIAEWRDHPFDAHRVAASRPLAYMKHVVKSYVANLIAWGDSRFRQFTRESVFEALQLYVMASHVLGPRPQMVPRRGKVAAESYQSLTDRLDDFSNALVALENLFPYSSDAPVSPGANGTTLLGAGTALYFCVPPNDELLEQWDTVADRLYKIRHCQDIEGVERQLALFAPPIDPAVLAQAAAQGLSLGSVLADLSSPPPIYRFTFLAQRANELCAEVRALGASLLSVLERKDAEELGRLRATQANEVLELLSAVRERQVLDARAARDNLHKARDAAATRLQHYLHLLGVEDFTVPPAPTLSADLTTDSQLPADTAIQAFVPDVDVSLVDSGERGVKVIAKEKEELDKTQAAKWVTLGANAGESLAGIFHLFPQFDGEGTPFGVGAGAWWGGQNLGAATSALAAGTSGAASFLTQEAEQAETMAAHVRRDQEWTFQANLAARDIVVLDKQITAADIQVQVAEKELANHGTDIEHAAQAELFLRSKFTSQELYQWLKDQLVTVYRQSYDLAFVLAKKTEKAYQLETGDETAGFIEYGYWDGAREGLLAGDKLQLSLRRLENAYLDGNRRELELSKSVSLVRLNPLALVELRETGRCYVTLPEELFDLDFRGHYFRRIKSVRVSIPCSAGPHTSVSCTLRLLSNAVRVTTAMNASGDYEHENDEGMWIDDPRFRTSDTPVTAIAASAALTDPGMFELNFRDERYIPFEFAGVISRWAIELSTDRELRQFDYSKISDVVMHLNYTAREGGELFKDRATDHLKDFLRNAAELSDQPLKQLFAVRGEFPTEWRQFLWPAAAGDEQLLRLTIGRRRFPFLVGDRNVVVTRVDLFARSTQAVTYDAILTTVDRDGATTESDEFSMPPSTGYGGLNHVRLEATDTGLDLEGIDIDRELSLKLKRTGAPDFTALVTQPEEIQDVLLVFHYRLG